MKYVQNNALARRAFDSLAAQNAHLAHWEATVADTRIHGTTRKQVLKMFQEHERPALLKLSLERFPCFQEGRRVVSRDGHVAVDKAYYSVPPEYLGGFIRTDAIGCASCHETTLRPADAFEEWKRVSAGRLCDYSGMTYALLEEHGSVAAAAAPDEIGEWSAPVDSSLPAASIDAEIWEALQIVVGRAAGAAPATPDDTNGR